MKSIWNLSVAALAILPATGVEKTDKFERDRAAILAMAGNYEVTFEFEETAALQPGYELQKPYHEEAMERVEVVEDTPERITLQHLLLVDMGDDEPEVIKHWAQVWEYEDGRVLNYEGGRTWSPVDLSTADVEGGWTQYVTQVDDSPRYKAAGRWVHEGNVSIWTSMASTRPLPRREHTKRSDYDVLGVVNHHIVTPTGWVHLQENRKVVKRDGKVEVLCLERGQNRYEKAGEEKAGEFAAATKFWEERKGFWNEVREVWRGWIHTAEGPITYVPRVEDAKLRTLVSDLEEEARHGATVSRERVEREIGRFLTQR